MEMTRAQTVVGGLAGLWAGVSLGGSLVAAPAKFQSVMLTRPVALDVGRVQFFWVGVTEAVICVALVVGVFFIRPARWRWPLLAVSIFAVQRALIMPPLDARTMRVIAGETVAPSLHHVAFVVLEVAKFSVLCALAVGVVSVVEGGRNQIADSKRA